MAGATCPKRCSFNWATAMKPWRHHVRHLARLPKGLLQLGHGDEAVETP